MKFSATIQKYGEQGEKTGWTFVEIPGELAEELFPGNKKSFRVKGKLDALPIAALSLIPVGGGVFILPLKAELRKQLGKRKGEEIVLQITLDNNPDPVPMPEDFAACMEDEPDALNNFKKLTKSHQHYYINWINSAKTESTRVKRMAQAIHALSLGRHYGEMIRALKKESL
ncbi:MAG: YdeI/OmpD-associated family protein [Chitinophagaceae bacterium]